MKASYVTTAFIYHFNRNKLMNVNTRRPYLRHHTQQHCHSQHTVTKQSVHEGSCCWWSSLRLFSNLCGMLSATSGAVCSLAQFLRPLTFIKIQSVMSQADFSVNILHQKCFTFLLPASHFQTHTHTSPPTSLSPLFFPLLPLFPAVWWPEFTQLHTSWVEKKYITLAVYKSDSSWGFCTNGTDLSWWYVILLLFLQAAASLHDQLQKVADLRKKGLVLCRYTSTITILPNLKHFWMRNFNQI